MRGGERGGRGEGKGEGGGLLDVFSELRELRSHLQDTRETTV